MDAHSSSAIVPLLVGDEGVALNAAERLFEAGYFLSAIRYPSVARGRARLRVTLRSDHTPEDLAEAAVRRRWPWDRRVEADPVLASGGKFLTDRPGVT